MTQTTPDAGRADSSPAPQTASTGLPPGYQAREARLDLSRAVADGGYLWWYVDAISDDGSRAMTLIVFVGSVFSPYYTSARRRGVDTTAENFCSFNTILYGPGTRKRWSMTERSRRHLDRGSNHYALGPSRMDWDGEYLSVSIDEVGVPLPRRMRGTIRVRPSVITPHTLRLDEHGRHLWHPLAPVARVEVDFPDLGTRWDGDGYLDSNEGNEPLADGFSGWDWARARLHNGDCAVRYEARAPQRQPHRLALRFDAQGALTCEEVCSPADLPRTAVWRIARQMPSANQRERILRTLEDTPFYARSLIDMPCGDSRGLGFHESLDMTRFESAWVQRLLPFRMPRRS